jgi:hypothetical protein
MCMRYDVVIKECIHLPTDGASDELILFVL